MDKKDAGIVVMLLSTTSTTLLWTLDDYLQGQMKVNYALCYTLAMGAGVGLLTESIYPIFVAGVLALAYHIIIRQYTKELS